MKEIEIKIEINNTELVLKKLEDNGCVFGSPLTQRDMVYIPQHVTTVPCPAGTNVLRIREQNNHFFLTLKRSDVGNHLSKVEHELEILDKQEMVKIIESLDYKLITDTTKIRRKSKIKDFEICLDSVEGLGNFLEVEKITNEDPIIVQKEMLDFLTSIGLDASKQIKVGYDVLWVQRNK